MNSPNSLPQKRRLFLNIRNETQRKDRQSLRRIWDFTCLHTVACSNVQLHLVDPSPALGMFFLWTGVLGWNMSCYEFWRRHHMWLNMKSTQTSLCSYRWLWTATELFEWPRPSQYSAYKMKLLLAKILCRNLICETEFLKKMNFFGLPSIDNYLNIFLIMLFSGPFIV